MWVQFAPGAKAQVERALNAAKAEFHYSFDDLDAFVVSLPEAALAGLSKNPNVVLIEEDVLRYPISIEKSEAASPSAVNLASQVVPYGIDMVQARDVWDANRDGAVDAGAPTGSTRTLCIIDSGLYVEHEDFQGLDVLGGYTTITDGWADDGFGHGSHVAGTIAAVNNALGVVGVTPGTVKLYIVRVFGDDGAWAYSSTLVDAANRCAAAGANIISMSLGGAKSSNLENRTFNTLYTSNGILSIAAAGNEGTTATSYPAGYASVVSVAAIDEAGVVADFSQKNADVELAAPGVGVLSTIPYIDTSKISVDGIDYEGAHIEYSGRGTTSGALVDGGLCASTGSWSGKVVLCQRGDISFYDKVMNVQNSGGAAAVIYNNVPGGFLGTLGEGASSAIVAISLSQEDGLYLVQNKIGATANVTSTIEQPASGYEYWDGTSMATPHVSAVAALVWSANPTWTNQQIRDALTSTAVDLGDPGRDNAYGYGLVQAKAALDLLGGNTPVEPQLSVTVTTDKATYLNGQTVYITSLVTDPDGAAVGSAAVRVEITAASGKITTLSCTTGADGTCTVQNKIFTRKTGTGTYTVVSTATKAGYISGTGATTFVVQ